MAWQFEKVYEVTPPTAPKYMAFDGRYIWVTGTNCVYVYEYFGESSGHEPAFEETEELTLNQYDGTKLKLIDTVVILNNCSRIVAGNNAMWVSDKSNATVIYKIDIATRKLVETINTPVAMTSSMIFENNKVWLASTSANVTNDRQSLYFYDEVTKVWGSSEIPTRKQLSRLIIRAGNNGSVYVTNFNNVSICKFDSNTGAFQSAIRTNAFPTSLAATTDQDIYVGSYAGMLSKVNSANVVTHPYSTLEVCEFVVQQPGSNYMWWQTTSGGVTRLGRLDTTDNSVMFSEPAGLFTLEEDWEFDMTKFTDRAFSNINITPPFSYKQLIDGVWKTINVAPYLIIIGATKLMAVRLDRPIYRVVETSVEGRAMVSTGPEDYMGEVG